MAAEIERDIPYDQDQLRLLIDLLPDSALLVHPSDGRILGANRIALRAYGFRREELLSRTIHSLRALDTQDSIGTQMAAADAGSFRFETVHRRKNGEIFPVEVNSRGAVLDGERVLLSVIRDISERYRAEAALRNEIAERERATAACLLTETVDITARKLAEEALRESEQRFRYAFEQAVVGIAHLSLDGGWLRVNQRLCEMLGYSRDELLATNFQSLTHPDDVATDTAALQRLKSGEVREYTREKRYLRKDGSILWAFLASTLVVSGQGEPLYFSSIVEDITHRKRAVDDLKLFKASVDRAPHSAYWFDADGCCVYANDAGCKSLGYDREELLKMHISDITRVAPERWTEVFALVKEEGTINVQSTHYRKDGSTLQVDITSSYLRYGDREYCIGFAVDITDRLRAQREHDKLLEQFNQAQKMESVGRLAGGVAHDFNNMLTIIQFSTQQALEQVNREQPVYEDLNDIANAAKRSADLTRQLLTFARKQTIAPRVLDLNETVGGMLKMLGRLLGENLELTWHPAGDLWPVLMDPSQLDQLLANLCVNSRDAISDVGTVTIHTANQSIAAEECARRPGFVPGDYVRLTVSDNGCGMDEETLASIFEPFFTTKGDGKGTGLGLATVYGIVTQNGGMIDVSSAPQRGTTIGIYLPRYLGATERARSELPIRRPRPATETVLVVEDERAISKMVTRVLTKKGYTVLVAYTPSEAIRVAREHSGQIHLLLTDVVLPEMNGQELSERVLEHCPSARCLFMSGYTADAIAHHGVLNANVSFIPKPFSAQSLAGKVREVLDAASEFPPP